MWKPNSCDCDLNLVRDACLHTQLVCTGEPSWLLRVGNPAPSPCSISPCSGCPWTSPKTVPSLLTQALWPSSQRVKVCGGGGRLSLFGFIRPVTFLFITIHRSVLPVLLCLSPAAVCQYVSSIGVRNPVTGSGRQCSLGLTKSELWSRTASRAGCL